MKSFRSLFFVAVLSTACTHPQTCPDGNGQPFATLQAIPQTDTVSLRWTVSVDQVPDSFRIERRLAGSGDFTEIAVSDAHAYSDTSALPQTDYEYRISAIPAGECDSGYSTLATAAATGNTESPPLVTCTGVSPRWTASGSGFRDVQWSPDAGQLSAGSSDVYHFFAADSGDEQFSIGTESFFNFLGWDKQATTLGFGSLNSITLYDAASGATGPEIDNSDFGYVGDTDWNADGSQLAVGGSHVLHLWDFAGAKIVANGEVHNDDIMQVAWNDSTSLIASADNGKNGLIAIWQADTLAPVTSIATFRNDITRLRWLQNSGDLAVQFLKGPSWIFDGQSWAAVRQFSGGEINCDGTVLAAVKSSDRRVEIYEAETGGLICSFDVSGVGLPARVTWAPDRDALAVSGDGLGVWDIQLIR